MSELTFNPADFARALLGWYQQQGRDLPWRNSRDPYRIWVFEIMLQQTTVATVLGRYDDFMQQFPSLADLAAASVEQISEAWAGLGEFPTLDLDPAADAETLVRGFVQQMGLAGDPPLVGTSHHIYSHFKLESLLYLVNFTDSFQVAETTAQWKTPEELEGLALHGAHKKVFEKVRTADNKR